MKLRPYQADLVNGARKSMRLGNNGIVLVLPTGGGKGKILPYIASGLVQNGKRVLVLAHREKLIKQLCESMDGFDLCYSRITSNRRIQYPCMIGMVETVRRRLEKMPEPDYILIDEAHHSVSSQYKAIFAKWPNAKRIGVTATPARPDGKGLNEVFSDIVIGPSMRWLIDEGFLAEYDYYAPPSDVDFSNVRMDKKGEYNEKDAEEAISASRTIVGDAVRHYKQLMPGKPAMVFCTGIQHAKDVAAEFNAAGIPSASIDGTMPSSEQEALMDDLAEGRILCLMSADLIGEGVDVPCVVGCIMLRKTASVVIFLQQAGRALRLKPDGGKAIILDHVGNCQTHGYPADHREWSLEGAPKKSSVCLKTCSRCSRSFHAHEAKRIASEECGDGECPIKNGSETAVERKEIEVIDADLVAVNDPYAWTGGIDIALARGAEYEALIAKADTEDKLKQIERIRGFKKGWRRHIMVSRGMVPPSKPNRFSRGRV